jgi:hypothetical protein
MKAKLIFITILMTVIPVLVSAQTKPGADSAPTNPAAASDAPAPNLGSINLPPAADASPSPEQVLQEYESGMVAITRNFSAQLAGITNAVQQGKMSSEEGKNTSIEQYLQVQMQLQLLSAWRQMKEQDLAKVAIPDDNSDTLPSDDEIVLVELPFLSFQLTPAVAERLSLTQSQREAVQQVMTRERHQMEPLMAQSRSIRQKLLALDAQPSNKKQIKTLADAQATLLAKVIVANARMQSEIYKLLTREQQRELDDLKRTNE